MDGLLLVDKPGGCTSHDIVALTRRALKMREVGHAGTLDPMATGVLVVLLGEATRLSSYLTADTKRYRATVRFGAQTDSLDADGVVTATSDAPAPAPDAIAQALASMVGDLDQVPPIVSAIKQDGVVSHARARKGEDFALPARPVRLESAEVLAVRQDTGTCECDLDVVCSKGFYVRSLARDLALALGTLGHLSALRRVASGGFTAEEALDGTLLMNAGKTREGALIDRVRAAVRPIAEASRSMRTLEVDQPQRAALAQGKRIALETADGICLVLAREGGRPVCIGEVSGGILSVRRGFPSPLLTAAPTG